MLIRKMVRKIIDIGIPHVTFSTLEGCSLLEAMFTMKLLTTLHFGKYVGQEEPKKSSAVISTSLTTSTTATDL